MATKQKKRLRFSVEVLATLLDLPQNIKVMGASYTPFEGGYVHLDITDSGGVFPDGDSVLVFEQTEFGISLKEVEQAPSLVELGWNGEK